MENAIVVPMYVDTVPNRNSRSAILLREAHREGKKVSKRTLANLTHWPADQVESLRRVLRGEKLVPIGELLVLERAKPHGHVEAILRVIRKLGLERLLGTQRGRERDRVVALIGERLIHPGSKLACRGNDECRMSIEARMTKRCGTSFGIRHSFGGTAAC